MKRYIAPIALFVALIAVAQVAGATVRTTATYFTNVTNYCQNTQMLPCISYEDVKVWSSTDSRGYPIIASEPITQGTGTGNGGYWVYGWTWGTDFCGTGYYCLEVDIQLNDVSGYAAPSNAEYQVSWVGRNGT